jgi:HAD superfamily hydrolase (TIGR01509 family)
LGREFLESKQCSRSIDFDMSKYKAIIFDMDGVIIDSEPLHERAYLEVFDELGYRENHGVNFDDYIGRTDKVLIEDFITRHKPAFTVEHLSDLKKNRFLRIMQREQPIFEDLPELVSRLAARYPMAVASGSLHPVIDAVLALKNLRQHFRLCVSASDVAQGKPAPDIFLHTAKLLKVDPHTCCVIEDSPAGVAAARAAKMDVIAITNSVPRTKLSAATYVVDSYAEIDHLLLKN